MFSRAEKRKASLIAVLSMANLMLSLIGALSVKSAVANPIHDIYIPQGTVSEPFYGKPPPKILLLSPKNNSVYRLQNVTLSLNVSCGDDRRSLPPSLKEIYYKADWQPNDTYLRNSSDPGVAEFSTTQNFTGVPEGEHSIIAYAVERRSYEISRAPGINPLSYAIYYHSYDVIGSSIVSFVVDTTPPVISFLSVENKTYAVSDVNLAFTTNEAVSQVSYVLDGEENVTLDGNVTLTGLSDGAHNVTVYAMDVAGNIGASETITFTVAKPEPFPATSVIAASGVSVAVVAVGLLVCFRKRKRGQPT